MSCFSPTKNKCFFRHFWALRQYNYYPCCHWAGFSAAKVTQVEVNQPGLTIALFFHWYFSKWWNPAFINLWSELRNSRYNLCPFQYPAPGNNLCCVDIMKDQLLFWKPWEGLENYNSSSKERHSKANNIQYVYIFTSKQFLNAVSQSQSCVRSSEGFSTPLFIVDNFYILESSRKSIGQDPRVRNELITVQNDLCNIAEADGNQSYTLSRQRIFQFWMNFMTRYLKSSCHFNTSGDAKAISSCSLSRYGFYDDHSFSLVTCFRCQLYFKPLFLKGHILLNKSVKIRTRFYSASK